MWFLYWNLFILFLMAVIIFIAEKRLFIDRVINNIDLNEAKKEFKINDDKRKIIFGKNE